MSSSFGKALKTGLIAFPIFVALLVSGCGSGGGGGSAPVATSFSITGTLAGAANATVNLTGVASGSTTTDANGNYSFTGLANGSYTVTPSKTGNVFSPTSTAVNVNGANVTGKNSAATPNLNATYCLSGTVSGAAVQNVTIFLNGANTGSTVTVANGNYSFCGLVSGSYTVTPFLQGYAFSTTSTITISAANPPTTNLVATAAPSGSSVVFAPVNPLAQTWVGATYNSTVISTTSGGTPPYHYQLDTFANGAPPIGMVLGLNGNLTGTSSVAGTYTFGVCAFDMVGSSSCKTTSIIVNPALSLTGTWSGSFVWPGAAYIGCTSQTIYPTISLVQNGTNITGSWGSATYSGPLSVHTMSMTGVSTIFGTGTPQTWTWDGANTIQASVGYGCYDLNTLAIQQHGYYAVTLTRQ